MNIDPEKKQRIINGLKRYALKKLDSGEGADNSLNYDNSVSIEELSDLFNKGLVTAETLAIISDDNNFPYNLKVSHNYTVAEPEKKTFHVNEVIRAVKGMGRMKWNKRVGILFGLGVPESEILDCMRPKLSKPNQESGDDSKQGMEPNDKRIYTMFDILGVRDIKKLTQRSESWARNCLNKRGSKESISAPYFIDYIEDYKGAGKPPFSVNEKNKIAICFGYNSWEQALSDARNLRGGFISPRILTQYIPDMLPIEVCYWVKEHKRLLKNGYFNESLVERIGNVYSDKGKISEWRVRHGILVDDGEVFIKEETEKGFKWYHVEGDCNKVAVPTNIYEDLNEKLAA